MKHGVIVSLGFTSMCRFGINKQEKNQYRKGNIIEFSHFFTILKDLDLMLAFFLWINPIAREFY